MGVWSGIKGSAIAAWSALRHLFHPRMTLRYPEQKLDLEDTPYPVTPRRPAGLPPGYKYDPKEGVGLPGFKGRHILILDKCTGCDLCAIACDGIAVAIEMQHIPKGLKQNRREIWPAVDYGRCVFCGLCVDPETPVVTNPGLKPINQIEIGDMVLTHTGDYKPVTKVWDMTYTGALYRIWVYGRPEPLVCTADHPILAVSRPMPNRKDRRLERVTGPLKFHKPEELKSGDYLVSPVVRKEVPIEAYEKDVSMFRGGVHKQHLTLPATPALFRLIGYYLAEGSCDGGRRVDFDFNITERDTIVKDCKALIEEFFGKRSKLKPNGKNGIRAVVDSTVAEDFFSQFGKGASNKKVPDWVFFAELPKVSELLKGYWQGDGTSIRQPRQKYINFTTTSKTLAFQVQELLARLGVVASIEGQHQKNRLPSFHVNVFGRWAIRLAETWKIPLGYKPTKRADKFHMTENFVYLPIRKIERQHVEHYRVMDVTVEGDHTFAPLGLATSNCVDACPFDALYMTNDYELAAYDKASLKYTPDMLAVPPKLEGKTYKVKIDTEKGTTSHG